LGNKTARWSFLEEEEVDSARMEAEDSSEPGDSQLLLLLLLQLLEEGRVQ
jgi:hypothetical protein